ncbi:hypothetical protein Tco_0651518, partial [Tanacetum coccineum]
EIFGGISCLDRVKSFVMMLQDFIKVPNPFDVVYAEKKLSENERSILKQTADVVTPPSDQFVNLGSCWRVCFKKGEVCRESSSGAAMAGESASKADDALSTQFSDGLTPVTASKVGEFIHGISSTPPKQLSVQGKKSLVSKKTLSKKVMGESVVGSSHGAAEDLCSSEAGSKCLISIGSSKTSTSLSSASTHSESFNDHLATPRLEHSELVKGKLERRLVRRDAALEKRDVEIERL